MDLATPGAWTSNNLKTSDFAVVGDPNKAAGINAR